MSRTLLRHLKPLNTALNIFGFATFKINRKNGTITQSNRYLNVAKVSFNCVLGIYSLTFAKLLHDVFGNGSLLSILSSVFLFINVTKFVTISIARYALREKILSCWRKVLKNDMEFSDKIGEPNHNFIIYFVFTSVLYVVIRNLLLTGLISQFPFNGLDTFYYFAVINYTEIQYFVIKQEYTIFFFVIQSYFKMLENKLNAKSEDRNINVTIHNMRKFYFNICDISRMSLQVMGTQTVASLLEAVAITVVMGYIVLSKLYHGKSTNFEFVTYQYVILWCVDAGITFSGFIIPSYLCIRNVSHILIQALHLVNSSIEKLVKLRDQVRDFVTEKVGMDGTFVKLMTEPYKHTVLLN